MSQFSISARTVVKILLVILSFYIAIQLIAATKTVWIWVAVSIFLALAMARPVNLLHKRKVPRSLAILIVYIGMFAAIFGVGLLVVPPIANQVQELAEDAPAYIEDLTEKNKRFAEYDERYHISEKLTEQLEDLPNRLGDAAGALQDVTVTAFQRILAVVTILVLTFFLVKDGGRWWRAFLEMQPPKRAERMRYIGDDIYKAVGGYVTGNLVISVIAGFITWVTLELLNVPFAVPLAVMMAFLDLIPMIGATIGGVIIGIITAFVDFPTALIVWVIVLVVYQQIENHIVQPQIYKHAVDLHPLVVIIAILIGGMLLGVLGALLAIPAAAAIQLIIKDLWAHREESELLSSSAGKTKPAEDS